MRSRTCTRPLDPLSRRFSLLGLILVLVLFLAVLMRIALPPYGAQQAQERRASIQLEVMACAQTLHALALEANPIPRLAARQPGANPSRYQNFARSTRHELPHG